MTRNKKSIVSTHGTMEPTSTTPTRYWNPGLDRTILPDLKNKDRVGLPGSRDCTRWGGSVEQVLTEIECVTVLVADDTLKNAVVTSTGSGYNSGQIDVLPRPFGRLHIQDEGMLQEDVMEVPTVRRGNRVSWMYMTPAPCKSELRILRGGRGTGPRVGPATPRRSMTPGGRL